MSVIKGIFNFERECRFDRFVETLTFRISYHYFSRLKNNIFYKMIVFSERYTRNSNQIIITESETNKDKRIILRPGFIIRYNSSRTIF